MHSAMQSEITRIWDRLLYAYEYEWPRVNSDAEVWEQNK